LQEQVFLQCKHRWIKSNVIHVSRTDWIVFEHCRRCDSQRETRFTTKIYQDGRTFTQMSRKNLKPEDITSTQEHD